jgi:hypothetical protein
MVVKKKRRGDIAPCKHRDIPDSHEIPEVPIGYSFCGMFRTEAEANKYADKYHKAYDVPVIVTYNPSDSWYSAWKLTGKAGRKIGVGWREVKCK